MKCLNCGRPTPGIGPGSPPTIPGAASNPAVHGDQGCAEYCSRDCARSHSQSSAPGRSWSANQNETDERQRRAEADRRRWERRRQHKRLVISNFAANRRDLPRLAGRLWAEAPNLFERRWHRWYRRRSRSGTIQLVQCEMDPAFPVGAMPWQYTGTLSYLGVRKHPMAVTRMGELVHADGWGRIASHDANLPSRDCRRPGHLIDDDTADHLGNGIVNPAGPSTIRLDAYDHKDAIDQAVRALRSELQRLAHDPANERSPGVHRSGGARPGAT